MLLWLYNPSPDTLTEQMSLFFFTDDRLCTHSVTVFTRTALF